MPDLEALLDSFQLYSTVRLFLEENGVTYDPRSIVFFNADFKDYLFGHKTPRMALLLRRATFSRWVNKYTNWYETNESEIAETISKSSELVYSTQAPCGKDKKARYIRWFLNETIAQEFELAQRDITLGHQYTLDELFVPTNNKLIQTVADIDIPRTFELFASCSTCPEVLKPVVQKYLASSHSHPTYDRLASDMYGNLAYASIYKKRWLEGGFTFLENILLLKPEESPAWKNLTIERRAALRKFRDVFQQNLRTQDA